MIVQEWRLYIFSVFWFEESTAFPQPSKVQQRKDTRLRYSLERALTLRDPGKLFRLITKYKPTYLKLEDVKSKEQRLALLRRISQLQELKADMEVTKDPYLSYSNQKSLPGPTRANFNVTKVVYDFGRRAKAEHFESEFLSFLKRDGDLDQFLKDNNLSRLGLPYPSNNIDSHPLRTYLQTLERRLLSESEKKIVKKLTPQEREMFVATLLSEKINFVLEAVEANQKLSKL